MNNLPGMFISSAFSIRNVTHFAHLRCTSYATHVALGEFYVEIISLIDKYAETFQGRYGIIMEYPRPLKFECCPIESLKVFRSWIDIKRDDLDLSSELKNIVDSVLELISTTLYKLENLK